MRALLAAAPYENVFIDALLTLDPSHPDVFVARDQAGIRAVAFLGPQFVFAGKDPQAMAAFALLARKRRQPRMLVAPRPLVEAFRASTVGYFPNPRAIRESQPVFALVRETFTPHASNGLDVARATPAEADELTIEAAHMTAGELGEAALPIADDYRRRIASSIGDGLFWRARRDGRLAFQCFVGSRSHASAQIQGVWTPPAMRGRGDATRAFSAICGALLREHRSLSLYVNAFNTGAIAMYERCGWVRAGEFQTVLY